LVAVVVPDSDFLTLWAKNNGISGSYVELCKNDKVREAILKDMDAVGKEAKVRAQAYVQAANSFEDPWI
jgi:long-chain acyl-CoA synthetase